MLFNAALSCGAKFVYGEIHILKNGARVAVAIIASAAFLFGYCTASGIYKKLSGTLNSDNRKDTYGNKKYSSVSCGANSTRDIGAYRIGDLITVTSANASASNLRYLHVKHNWGCGFNYCGGSVRSLLLVALVTAVAKISAV